MLTEIFEGILSASLSTAPLILLIMAVSPLLKKRYAPGLRHIIWLVVALRLCLPVSMPDATVLTIPAGEPIAYLSSGAGAVARAFTQSQPGAGEAAATGGSALSPLGLLAMVWLTGAGAFLTAHTAAYLHTRRKLARWSVAANDAPTAELLTRCKKELGVERTVPVYRCEKLFAPLLIELFHPAILIPNTEITPAHLRCVLLHELSHLRRRDLWFKLLLAVVSSLHWFNPLVWLMAKNAEINMELACDAQVLSLTGGVSRREYGMAILSLIEAKADRHMPLTTGFFGDGKQMLRRFEGIMDSGAKKRGTAVIALTVAAAVASIALVGCGAATVAAQIIVPSAVEPAAHEDSPLELEGDGTIRAAFQEDIRRVYENGDGTGGKLQWALPGYYTIIADFGMRYNASDFHTGIDIGGSDVSGKPVVAASGGKVVVVNEIDTPGVGYGIHVVIDHGGKLSTLYAHLSEAFVEPGQLVIAGQVLGAVGATGFAPEPHLHFEIREGGKTVDPKAYLLPPD